MFTESIEVNFNNLSNISNTKKYSIDDIIIEDNWINFGIHSEYFDEHHNQTHVAVVVPIDGIIINPGDDPINHRWCIFSNNDPEDIIYELVDLDCIDINIISTIEKLFNPDGGSYIHKAAILEYNKPYIIGQSYFRISNDNEIVEI